VCGGYRFQVAGLSAGGSVGFMEGRIRTAEKRAGRETYRILHCLYRAAL